MTFLTAVGLAGVLVLGLGALVFILYIISEIVDSYYGGYGVFILWLVVTVVIMSIVIYFSANGMV